MKYFELNVALSMPICRDHPPRDVAQPPDHGLSSGGAGAQGDELSVPDGAHAVDGDSCPGGRIPMQTLHPVCASSAEGTHLAAYTLPFRRSSSCLRTASAGLAHAADAAPHRSGSPPRLNSSFRPDGSSGSTSTQGGLEPLPKWTPPAAACRASRSTCRNRHALITFRCPSWLQYLVSALPPTHSSW